MVKSVLLIGLGNFGLQIAKELYELGHEVMGIDIDEEAVNNALPLVTNAQIGDSTNEAFLRSLGVSNFDICIVAISGDFQSSLETTSLLKEMGAPMVVARAERDVQAKFLLRNGADEVVNPIKQMAKWTVVRYVTDYILDFIQLNDEYSIFEATIPSEWWGKTVGQIDIRHKYGINILAIKEDGKMCVTITPDLVLSKGCTLFILGEQKAIEKCFKI